MPYPVDFDRPLGTLPWHALPQVALYVLLALSMGLPAQRIGWTRMFHIDVHLSAGKILLLKILFVMQTVLLSSLASDLIFQRVKDPKKVPEISTLWLTPVTLIEGLVLMVTRSSLIMISHLAQSLTIAAIPSLVLLMAKFSPCPAQTIDINILLIYSVSMLGVFWEDIKHCMPNHNLSFPTLKFFSKTVAEQPTAIVVMAATQLQPSSSAGTLHKFVEAQQRSRERSVSPQIIVPEIPREKRRKASRRRKSPEDDD